jgi:hypothetical protein
MLLIIQYLCYYYESLLTYGFSGASMNIRYYIDSFAKVLLLCFTSKKRSGSCWFFSVWHTKKAWNPTVVVPRFETFALPFSIEQQREAHAEYKIYPRAISSRYTCAYTHIHKRRTVISTRGITLYPVGHLPLLSPDREVKVAKFQNVRTERNKRLLNMSATLRR